jgi:hypothetical protein
MVQYVLDAEERRRVGLAVSVRHETNFRLSNLLRRLWPLNIVFSHWLVNRGVSHSRDYNKDLLETAMRRDLA